MTDAPNGDAQVPAADTTAADIEAAARRAVAEAHLDRVVAAALAIEPSRSRIVAVRWPEEKFTEGGLELPDAAAEAPWIATVAACGEIVTECEPGEAILFPPLAGVEVKLPGRLTALILEEEDVLGVVVAVAASAAEEIRDAILSAREQR